MAGRFTSSITIVVLSLAVLSGCATPTPRPSFFPPELGEDWKSPRAPILGEVPLWPITEARGYERRLRVFVLPPFVGKRVAIRIDTSTSGKTSGFVVRTRPGATGQEIIEHRPFTVKPSDLMALDQLIEQSTLWSIYPEHWVREVVCIDGVSIVLERVTEAGYRVSEANAQCTAPLAVLKVVDQMINMAHLGDTEVHDWLR